MSSEPREGPAMGDYRKEGGRGQSESGLGRLNEAFGFY